MMEDRITTIAKICHEANKVWCEANGDFSQKHWDEAEKWQRDSCINGVQFVLDDPSAPPSANHENWLAVKRQEGWTYGETKDPDAKTHPCMVPHDDLPEVQKIKDSLFRNIVLAFVK